MTASIAKKPASVPSNNFSAILDDLKPGKRWVMWRYEPKPGDDKPTKVPCQTNGLKASTSTPSTWASFNDVAAAWMFTDIGFDGIGFVFSDADDIVGIDIDGCIDAATGELSGTAQKWVQAFDSYTELSPSGTGLHIFVKGKKPGTACRKGKYEMYEKERFFTMTGAHWSGTPTTVESRQDVIELFYAETIEPPQESLPGEPGPQLPTVITPTGGGFEGSDKALLDAARAARNGDKFRALFDDGRTDLHGGDDSGADLALADMLAWWCGPNIERIDTLFRQSALFRDKWDARRGSQTYGEITVAKAVEKLADWYGQQATAEDLVGRYSFVREQDQIYDAVTRRLLSRAAFNVSLQRHFPGGKGSPKATVALTSHPRCILADNVTWTPIDSPTVYENGRLLLNTYQPPALRPQPGDPAPWLDHLAYVFPDPAIREHITDWMAFNLQYPAIKINHQLLVAGAARVGKDTAFQPLLEGLGRDNVAEIQAERLKSQFNDYIERRKLVVVQEIMSFGRRDIENKLKPFAAAPPQHLDINPKGQKPYSVPNVLSMLVFSNHSDAMTLGADDGRFMCVWVRTERKTDDYYADLYRWFERDGGYAIAVNYLLQRDVSRFNPGQLAPMTDYKRQLIENSADPVTAALQEALEAEDNPFHVDLVRLDDVEAFLHRRKYGTNGLPDRLRALDMTRRKVTYRTADGRLKKRSVWIVRDRTRYEDMSDTDLGRAYDEQAGEFDPGGE